MEKTSLLISICHPASLCPTNRLLDLLYQQSALAPTRLPNISQPASLNKTDTGQGPLLLGALAGIPLSLDINEPASRNQPSIHAGTDPSAHRHSSESKVRSD